MAKDKSIGTAPSGMSHTKVDCDTPAGTPPAKEGQSSGEVKHARSGNKIENLKDAPKSNSI